MAFPEEYLIQINTPLNPWDSHVRPREWTEAVVREFRKIESTKAGAVLLHYIRRCGVWIAVEPTVFGECNAHGSALPRRIDPTKNRMFTGVVKFDPDSYLKGSTCFHQRNRGKNDRGFLPDEILFHELLHAHRGSIRLSLDKQSLSGGLVRYSNDEEFLAVVLTNIYISDVSNHSKSGLRRDHTGGVPLEKQFRNSLCFFQSSTQVLPLLKRFRQQQEELFLQFAEVKADFNPLHAMVHHPAKVEAASRTKAAQQREISVPKMPVSKSVPQPVPPLEINLDVIELLSPLAKEALSLLQ